MPSTSPGQHAPSDFVDILPGAPVKSLQSCDTFIFRHKRYIVYISGRQVNLLTGPTNLVQALTFNNDLVAVAAEATTGKIVIASENVVWVLEPVTEGWTTVWWEKALLLLREDQKDETKYLSWGSEGEVLVGGSRQLSLFSTLPSSRTSSSPLSPTDDEDIEERRTLWTKDVSSPVKYAAFSPSANLIATCGSYDRLIKVWRRLSFEEGLFDYTYLRHPGAVTHLEWRPADERAEERRESGIGGGHEDNSEILYTIANDGLLRIWRTGGIHDLDILILHTTIDLDSAIPRSPSLTVKGEASATLPTRFAFTIPSSQFCDAITASIGLRTEKLSHSLEHLKVVSAKEPDVVVSFDGSGRMSAWGLQSIGHKRRPESPAAEPHQAFHIAHAERLPLRIAEDGNARFQAWFDDNTFNILVHGFQGYVQWWRGDVETFFSPSAAGSERLSEITSWTGHSSSPIRLLQGSSPGTGLVSCADDNEVSIWDVNAGQKRLWLNTNCSPIGEVLDICLMDAQARSEARVAILQQSPSDECELQLVTFDQAGRQLDCRPYTLHRHDDNSSWLLHHCTDGEKVIFVGLSNDLKGFVFDSTAGVESPLREFSIPVNNDNVMQRTAVVLDSSDLSRVGFVSVDSAGTISLHHLQLTEGGPLEPIVVTTYESGIENSSILAVSNEYAAIASLDGTELAIVNLRDGYLEHRKSMSGHIRRIVPSPKYNMVAVGYDTSVNILVESRYEHHDERPSWVLLESVSMAGIGLPISCVAWLRDNVVIAAGNSIFVSDGNVAVKQLDKSVQESIGLDSRSEGAHGISSLARWLKAPLPIWHPSLFAHTVRHGHWHLATSLVHTLSRKLKFWSEGDELQSMLDLSPEDVYTGGMSPTASLDRDAVTDLMQQLEEKDLPEVSQVEQERLKRVITAMAYCSEHVSGLDNGALRFLFGWKLELLHLDAGKQVNGTQANGLSPASTSLAVPKMHWREIAFAYHSTTQQPLLDILIAHYDNKVTWSIARRLGLFAWLCDRQALEQIFEALAQSAYRSASPADPINASLYFLALHKKSALIALWRIATWHREQRATVNFLKRDFTQVENQTAAKKNAYALMGKKRFDYAAAFFLLAEDAQSACSVLASQCDDIMLAIAVARLYSGDGSAVLRTILSERLVPQATKAGDRWMMSWCHSVLGEQDSAAEALLKPLDGVRTWRQDDPNTLTLYKQLRKRESEHEYDAVLRAARIMRRMGLWLLALELVSRWEFKSTLPTSSLPFRQSETSANGVNGINGAGTTAPLPNAPANKPPSMLDGFETSMPAVDNDKAAREAKAAELLKKIKAKKDAAQSVVNEKKPEPTQFIEPDANSLLDSFGF